MTKRLGSVAAAFIALCGSLIGFGMLSAALVAMAQPTGSNSPSAGGSGLGNAGYPPGATPITGNATGTTGAVVGTLAAAPGKFTYVCGFHIDAIGGTAVVGPITLAGIVGSSMVFQGSSSAGGNAAIPEQLFAPYCIPANAINTAITLTTTADGTATAVDVNLWGFQQ